MLSSKKLKEEIEELRKRVENQDKMIITLSATVADVLEKLREKEESLEEQTREIRLWNEGLNNVLNYSLDVAKGEKK